MSEHAPTIAAIRNSKKRIPCSKCKQEVAESELAASYYLCPHCGAYCRIPARIRAELLTDTDTFTELFGEDVVGDPIDFPTYPEKVAAAKEKSGENEAVLCGKAKICGYDTCLFIMNPDFMLGSMGTVVGDRIAALFEYATARNLPVIGYTVSGGARMQEGVLSLMQMAKVSMALKRHSDAGLFYLSCLTDPTMGGLTASFAMLGDVIIAEPGAQIGFAGKRVIEQNTGETLPPDFQSAEFQLKTGFLDSIVERKDQRNYLSRMLAFHDKY
ncbi:MAG TPA: acetyl-CoA carboxylase carboxyl transferase subunit beta [Clostridiales bacterium]|nr:acetyl-CoA carboxylase carboxyl transferase subunit beta [Clostridiales bacterium]